MAIYTGSNKHLGGTETVTKRQDFFYGLVQKNVLITGANGQLGNELRERKMISNNPFHFIYTDADTLDITDGEQVRRFVDDHNIAYMVNCAAYTNVEKAESDQETALRINALGPENLARVAHEFDIRLIHISTDYVFDGTSDTPYTEKDATNPQSVYGKTKLKGEEAVLKADPSAVIIRTSWLYSEFGNNFVKTMLRLLSERDRITVVSDQHGSPTYAADLAEMIMVILEADEKDDWKPGIYHFSNAGATTWYDFAQKIKELSGNTSCVVEPVTTAEYPTVAPRPAYSVMDISKIQNAFHVEIPRWENALQRCLNKLKIARN